MKKIAIVLTLVLVLLFSVSCAQKKQKAVGGVQSAINQIGDVKNIKITADAADLRSGCSNNAGVIQSLNKNNTYDVLSQVADWYAVKLPDNSIGFISKGQCKPVVVESKKSPPSAANTSSSPQTAASPGTANTNANSRTLTASEQQMINLVNQSRAQSNLAPLQVDMEVTSVARIKAQDMIDNHYFSHSSPKYGSPFDMMKSFGINYVAAGENIAGNQSVTDAETALMNSPGHRANILNPDFTHIGIGIKSGGPYGNMISQMFVSKPQ
jgi:uncharacterized YkwD family protein